MPTLADPIEFTKICEDRRGLQRCGNRVQLEDAAGSPVTLNLDAFDWPVVAQYGTVNDNEMQWTVPANREWHLCFLGFTYTADANAGARQLVLEAQNALAPVDAELGRAGATQAATEVRVYMWGPGVADLTAFRDTNFLTTPPPVTTILKAGDILHLWDNNNVSGGDQIQYWLQYGERTVA